ncbi:MAG: helix-turn-helix domain-containing protein, partial [Novosphingobium sp.]
MGLANLTIRKTCPSASEGDSMPKLITIAQFQREFGVSRSTVYRLVKRGELHFVRIGRSVRISSEEADRW